MKELDSDCTAIFNYLLKDKFYSDTIEKHFDVNGAVGEALDAMYDKSNVTAPDSCLVIAVIVQWLVRYVTKHIMHLLTPEALINNARKIHPLMRKAYFKFQDHFSFKNLVSSQIRKMELNNW